jgi:hypothetical protein
LCKKKKRERERRERERKGERRAKERRGSRERESERRGGGWIRERALINEAKNRTGCDGDDLKDRQLFIWPKNL